MGSRLGECAEGRIGRTVAGCGLRKRVWAAGRWGAGLMQGLGSGCWPACSIRLRCSVTALSTSKMKNRRKSKIGLLSGETLMVSPLNSPLKTVWKTVLSLRFPAVFHLRGTKSCANAAQPDGTRRPAAGIQPLHQPGTPAPRRPNPLTQTAAGHCPSDPLQIPR